MIFRFSLLGLWLIACTHSRVERHEASAELHETVQATTDQRVDETVQRGPETITTTVEEFAYAPQDGLAAAHESGLAPDEPAGPPGAAHPQPVPRGAREIAGGSGGGPLAGEILVKRTVTVDQRGTVTETIAAEAKGASTAALAVKVKDKGSVADSTRWGPPWWVYALVGVALAGAGYVAWKLKPPWLGWLWKLLKVAR